MRAHWLVARGFNAKQISEELQKWLVQNETFFVQVISNISFLRAGGRLAALDKGIAECLLNYAENNKVGIVMGSDCTKLDPKMYDPKLPDQGMYKVEPIAVGKVATLPIAQKMISKFVKMLDPAFQRKGEGGKFFDMLVSTTGRPWIADKEVAELKSKVNVRHIYYGPVSCAGLVHLGPDGYYIAMWPAD